MLIIAPRSDLPAGVRQKIESVSPDIKLIATKDRAVLEQYWPEVEVMFGGRLTPALLSKCKKLRWVQATSAGVERYLFPEFIASDIILTNVRGMHAQTITEHVLLLMLAWTRRFRILLNQQREKVWQDQPMQLLAGKHLLIIGLGGIGCRIAEVCHALGMRVAGVDIYDKQLPVLSAFYHPQELHRALPQADFVVVAVPLTEKTRGMIGAQEFSLMKNTAYFVNIGRGKVVDEQALVAALQSGQIAGAGLDVFAEEPLPPDSPLWQMANVYLTPHLAGSMPDYLDHAADIFCENLHRYLKGEKLKNLVNKRTGF